MALQGATAGGEWLTKDEWLALGRERAIAIFRVKGHQPEKPMANGPVFPVDCDVLILSGARKGELHVDQSVIGKGLTTPLRKVRVGDDMLATMGLGLNGAVTYPQANPPVADVFEHAKALYADGRDPFVEAARAMAGTALVGAGVQNGQAAAPAEPWGTAASVVAPVGAVNPFGDEPPF